VIAVLVAVAIGCVLALAGPAAEAVRSLDAVFALPLPDAEHEGEHGRCPGLAQQAGRDGERPA
jgi:hypothetical protein